MSSAGRALPDVGLVVAARQGDQRALDDVVTASLPLVYNIVGRALRGHADVDDVVQETLVRVIRYLPALNDPAAYRSWLVAITIRQVRDWETRRRVALNRDAGLDAIHNVPDPASDFAGMTILRLGLTDQRREVAEATRWLDPDDQELLSLWWLEETGEITRNEVADALGLSPGHVAVRIHRMKEQIQSARAVVRALRARPGCPELGAVTAEWDGTPSSLWRKRLARHVRDCAFCVRLGSTLLPIDRLLAGLPLLPLPAGLGAHLPNVSAPAAAPAAAASAVAPPSPAVGPAAGPTPPTDGGSGQSVVGLAANRPRGLVPSLVAGVAAAVLAITMAVVIQPDDPSAPSWAAPPSAAPTAVVTPSVAPPPSARPASKAPVPPVVSSARKGVGVWNFAGASQALANSKAGWYYTWGTQHPGISTPRGATFVPMIRSAENVTATELARARAAGPYLLTFNEPDLAEQANMTVEQALDLWPQLMATGSRLGSPAVAWGAPDPQGWLDRFMTGAQARGHRVDFITLHWFGADFTTATAVAQLRQYLQAVYQRYRKPIWLTEFALIRFGGGGSQFPSPEQQAAFLTAATAMLGQLPYLQRYAWFGLPATDQDRSGLFRDGTEATAVGRAFQAAR
ncbi:sigma-70 family RNA polymerase sigma factor [Micromonospora sp. M51]|uniref:sigma-70 family RNA polymerase sigma factor n=1 Tax=unclassified Micromonospora TaxID=2617518 RepID=UPI001B3822E5|nr:MULTISPECIES: sigma-70 family RNA polymerase sigma factor [unclassified Micromonospora]MBQ1009414.1 sigma-70 family RNA polymerase sigma factor [Micromonospora sp. M51]MBQ1034179.1 sigma-70 family RNA polymerase sigma factor [Micromonospora sp. C97]